MNDPLASRAVAILGFGHQGEAQAHNLRANGIEVVVGARPGRDAESRAHAQGFPTFDLDEAARRAAIVAMLLPDEAVPAIWPGLSAVVDRSAVMVFAHGFNLLYSDLAFSDRADVVLVSPTGPGHVLRRQIELGTRLPAYVAVHRDGSGEAWAMAEGYAHRIQCGPLLRTTVRDETEVDLFGEQTVLCGGLNAMVIAAFETLVDAGYAPEMAYLECVHQVKYLADLLHDRGPRGFRAAISSTALYGDLTRGPRVIGEAARSEMRAILAEIRSGGFAREWLNEIAAGRGRVDALVRRMDEHPIETARNRALDPRRATGPEPRPEAGGKVD